MKTEAGFGHLVKASAWSWCLRRTSEGFPKSAVRLPICTGVQGQSLRYTYATHFPLRSFSTSIVRNEEAASSSVSSSAGSAAQPQRSRMPPLRAQHPRTVPAPQQDSRGEVPAYELTFTCKPCKTRSTHRITKHGYHNGTTLITCPGCKNRHIISDHLKIFNDASVSFEDVLAKNDEILKRGMVNVEGDIELWDDGTQNERWMKEAENDSSIGDWRKAAAETMKQYGAKKTATGDAGHGESPK